MIFTDGRIAMRWLVWPYSSALYDCLSDLEFVHGHEGRTTVRILDAADVPPGVPARSARTTDPEHPQKN